MDIIYTPQQVAERLHVSTTTLRRYEALHLIPDIPRTASKRKVYSPIHVQAFLALRALMEGFGIPVSYEVMGLIQKTDFTKYKNRQFTEEMRMKR